MEIIKRMTVLRRGEEFGMLEIGFDGLRYTFEMSCRYSPEGVFRGCVYNADNPDNMLYTGVLIPDGNVMRSHRTFSKTELISKRISCDAFNACEMLLPGEQITNDVLPRATIAMPSNPPLPVPPPPPVEIPLIPPYGVIEENEIEEREINEYERARTERSENPFIAESAPVPPPYSVPPTQPFFDPVIAEAEADEAVYIPPEEAESFAAEDDPPVLPAMNPVTDENAWNPLSNYDMPISDSALKSSLADGRGVIVRRFGTHYFIAVPLTHGIAFGLAPAFVLARVAEVDGLRHAVIGVGSDGQPYRLSDTELEKI